MTQKKISIVEGIKKYEISKIKEEKAFETVGELAKLIEMHTWSPFLFQEAHPEAPEYKHRKASNMCGGSCFGIDIDGGLSLTAALDKVRELGLATVVGTSKSHQKEKNGVVCDRFRIVFVLSGHGLSSPAQVRGLFELLAKHFPALDPACKDAARIFYPCKEIVLVQEGPGLQVPDIVRDLAPTPNRGHVTSNERYPLSKATYDLIENGAAPGTRNEALVKATVDAIQQQWPVDEYLDLLRTSSHEWLHDSVAVEKIEERYKNFKPTYAPRVPNASAPNRPNKIELLPLNQVKPALLKWLSDNDVAVSYNRTLYMGGNNLLADDIVRKVVLYLSYMNMAVHEKLVEYNLQEWIDERRVAHLEAVRSDISQVNIEAGTAELKRFLQVLKHDASDLDTTVMRHMLWQVKRKINGLRTKHEMMLVLTGGQGAGKSTALRDVLFAPLGDLAYSAADFNALADQREGRLFSDHYIIMFDEMSGAHKSDMERTKQIITSGVIKQRRMGTTSHDSIPMNATFFGSANTPLELLIRDSTGMRRFYEIVVEPAVVTRLRWPALKTIDPKLLWASVDHTDEVSPVEAEMEALQVKQENLRDKSVVEYLLSEGILEKTTVDEHYTSALALSHVVDLTMGQKWSSKNLAKEWKRFDIEKKRFSGGTKYGVRIVDTDILNSLSTKYGMRIKAGEF